tara:strand:+ start:52 stop:495 length:444 start_codon:yes stop_codon:yes gene_type:complete
MKQQMKGGTMYGLKGNKERMRKKFIGEKMGSDKGTKRSILNLKKNKKKKPVQKKSIGKMLETFSPVYSIMKGKGPMSKLASELGKAAGPLSPIGQLAQGRRKDARRRQAEMQGSNRMTPMAKMMAGGMMKRSRPIDGIATKGKTRAV